MYILYMLNAEHVIFYISSLQSIGHTKDDLLLQFSFSSVATSSSENNTQQYLATMSLNMSSPKFFGPVFGTAVV